MERVKRNARIYVLVLLAVALFFVARELLGASERLLTVAFLDVGQGDAIFIEAPNGNQLLIDGGAGRSVLRELGGLFSFGDRSIDAVLATHPDKDHIGGLPDVLRRFEVGYFIEPGVPADTGAYKALLEAVSENKITRVLARRGMEVDLGDGVVLQVLYPDHDFGRTKDTNSASIVAKLTYGATEFMLTGDAPLAVEARLVSLDGAGLAADVLKAGHHGSRTSSGAAFVGAVGPAVAVISAGKDNSYGHPHQEVLSLLGRLRIPVVGTYEKGTIVFESDGSSVRMR
ncbi:MAG: ComEC/Rec2 family competence protein [bacterium]|nr:ComEC/Rec2 family competence protein [bacterium]